MLLPVKFNLKKLIDYKCNILFRLMRTADPCKRPQLNLSRRELSHKHCASSESQRDVNQLSEKR
jgi:hypothetical protein